jgi:hypothetical protein
MKKRLSCTLLSLTPVLLGLAGCRPDPTVPNETNLAAAVSAALRQSPKFIRITLPPLGLFPLTPPKDRPPVLKALVEAGLLEETVGPADLRVTPHAFADDLISEEGLGFAAHVAVSDPNSVRIVRFSVPTGLNGKTVVEVEYTHGWLPSPLLTDPRYRAVADALTKKAKTIPYWGSDRMRLALYNDGWRPAE